MVDTEVIIKPCVVILEQYTPKAQKAFSAELKNAIHERNILTAKSKKRIFSALDEIDVDDEYNQRREGRKNLILQEILDSEVTYLKQLEVLANYFVEPIKSKRLISNLDLDVIFGNINTIYEVNGALLKELKKDLTNVASAFLKMAPFFKLYSVYACDYTEAIKKLHFLIMSRPTFAKFIDNQETRPEVQMKLSALLIAPIQRIPRYCLLLQQVLENSTTHDSDYLTLKRTYSQLQQAASHINTLLAKKENDQRLLELQRSLYKMKPRIIKPDRMLIKEGFLKKFSTSNEPDERKYCVLLNDILMLCDIRKSNVHCTNSLKCELILPLNKCILKYHPSTKIMHINCDNEQLYIYHESSEESETWFKTLNDTICMHIYNRQTLRKDSSLRRPANKKNIDSYSDSGVSPYKHRIRRRVYDDADSSTIYKSESNDSEQDCFNLRPLKRKSLRETPDSYDSPSKRQKMEDKDSLFPLRYHSRRQKSLPPIIKEETPEEDEEEEEQVVIKKSDSRWKIVNVFTNFSRSLRRLFGYE